MGVISSAYRKPDQIIHPYFFGDEAQKQTCLWLTNLPKLFHAKQPDLFNDIVTHVGKGEMLECKSGNKMPRWYAFADKSKGQDKRAEIRSKTFNGIAEAMAEQWGGSIIPEGWKKVINTSDCIFEEWDDEKEMAICPTCLIEFQDCNCPGNGSEDQFEYKTFNGNLFAKPIL